MQTINEIQTYIKLKYSRDKITREYLELLPEPVIIGLYNKVFDYTPEPPYAPTPGKRINRLFVAFSTVRFTVKGKKMQLASYCKYIDELLIKHYGNERN